MAPVTNRDGVSEDDAIAMLELLKDSRGLRANQSDTTRWCDHTLFPESDKAAQRVKQAIANKEKIGIFGDYDCDGITSTAQLVRALRRRQNEPIVRLPHRVHDGYGLKPEHIEEFHEKNVTLLITVDTGISAHEAVDAANAKNIDVIILDHHHVLTPPDAYAIMHPALAPDFPHPHPSAAGVVFFFLHALEGPAWLERETDVVLAMLGTVADLVMLRGLNRKLVQEGLLAAKKLPLSSLKLFIDNVTGAKPLTSLDVAFRLAPRINAAGRMADPLIALTALLEGGELLKDLDSLNSIRQDTTTRALEQALREMTPKRKTSRGVAESEAGLPSFLTIASSSYPHGILGLLSGKLTEKFGRPSMAVHIEGELCTASLRSTAHYNIVSALHRAKNLLLSFGGHAQAAGCTFRLEHYIELCTCLEKDAEKNISAEQLVPTLAIDAALPASAITNKFCSHLSSLEPFGQGNPEPLFLLENVTLENVRRVGADSRHLQAQVGGCKLIGFGLGELEEHAKGRMDIVCRAGIDTWQGAMKPQLFAVDMRVMNGIQDSRSKVEDKKIRNRVVAD